MAVTIRAVAAAAGVSRGTVDRVLHNRGGVKPEVAEEIRLLAAKMGYLPNRAGKILAARKQPIKIGCFLPSIGNAFFDDVVRGFRMAEREFSDFGVTVELREIKGFQVDEHIDAIRGLVEAGCSALCVSTIDMPRIRACIDGLVAAGVPVITVNTDLTDTKRLCYVGADYRMGGRTAAGLLTLCAPERLNLLIVTGSLKMKGHNERIRGFSRALRENQMRYRLVDVFESQDNDDYAYEMSVKVLREHPEINCIYITAAGVGGVCRAVSELGIKNRSLRILCFDETPSIKKLLKEGIIDFTIGQEPEQQGYQSIRKIFDYFMEDRKKAPPDFLTSTVIKIRENL